MADERDAVPTGALEDVAYLSRSANRVRILDAQPMVSEDVEQYPFPSNRRRYYQKLDGFPGGLVVIGDAIASFNPIYGQGMSVAALEALGLHHALASGGCDDLALRFFDRASAVVDVAWAMAAGADLQFPETTGPKPWSTELFGRYLSRLTRSAHTDGELRDALFHVMTMEQPPTTLLRPGVAWRVFRPSVPTVLGRLPALGRNTPQQRR